MTYQLRRVDTSDDEIVDILRELHILTFGPDVNICSFEYGDWWLLNCGREPVGFCGMVTSSLGYNIGYLKRAGVISGHRGGFQRRMIRVREARARVLGYEEMVTDTTDAIHSSNNLMDAGYRLWDPDPGWAFNKTLYWYKKLS